MPVGVLPESAVAQLEVLFASIVASCTDAEIASLRLRAVSGVEIYHFAACFADEMKRQRLFVEHLEGFRAGQERHVVGRRGGAVAHRDGFGSRGGRVERDEKGDEEDEEFFHRLKIFG